MPFHRGPWEIGLILVIILIIFGVGELPQVGSAIGKGLSAFRANMNRWNFILTFPPLDIKG